MAIGDIKKAMRVAGLPVRKYDIDFNAVDTGDLYLTIRNRKDYLHPLYEGTFPDGTSMGEITDAVINSLLYDKR